LSAYIPESLRLEVIERDGNRCEYCRLSQLGQEATFHIDHIIPVIAGGATVKENLALACVSCSLRKGASQVAQDPESSEIAPLFHPRGDKWADHFRWVNVVIEGLSPTGRATVEALKMNREIMLAIRNEEMLLGRNPTSE
jgi:hypothetical protein